MENYRPQTHSAPEAPENGRDCNHSDNGNGPGDRQDDDSKLDEEEEAEAEGGVAEQERDWEPAIGAIDNYVPMDEEGLLGDEGDEAMHRAHRHDTEIPLLKHQPHIVKFLLCSAGAIIPDSALADQPHGYDSHRSQLDQSCIWAPFTSQIDYEVAQWVKLRGQGSTAFSDLLEIEGVCENLGLSYKNSQELNKIIDTEIPAHRPCFQRKEILVASEAFNVYYRDIIECVKALYGDPEFAQHLIFTPE
ncbi:hypothetical protein CY34DRAFT_18999 [Suillus luteus UH-Slu-Lm8-n1]|uniref:Uncharacterized protein n=1 Tax=Suillus luteus UH-Slu-Lm8-n1 TaxID=930992 RepID=A0A0D0A2X4_9AGAM|nr:hypothetical protein CY34DRAFT_18999 [Suillus luteus UH-Slu-Lm8-n1]